MTEIEWTDGEREAIADVIASQYLHLRDGRSVQIATAALAKLAPFVAAREAQAAAKALADAADELERFVDEQHPAALNPDQWLRDRADALEDDR